MQYLLKCEHCFMQVSFLDRASVDIRNVLCGVSGGLQMCVLGRQALHADLP